MNQYIDAQVKNMIGVTKAFYHGCTLAATKDDEQISTREEKDLKKIQKATKKFIHELERISV